MDGCINRNWESPSLDAVSLVGEVHLWRAQIHKIDAVAREEDLGSEERAKLGGMRNPLVIRQFRVANWLTRHILAKYTGTPPSDLDFEFSGSGKPRLARIEFNRSHSGDWFVLAVSSGAAIGVDIEVVRTRVQMSGIVERWFEEAEKEKWLQLSLEQRLEFFHQIWTKKEAILKAWSIGLVGLINFAAYEAKSWTARFEPAEGVMGCVAGVGTAPDAASVRLFDYEI